MYISEVDTMKFITIHDAYGRTHTVNTQHIVGVVEYTEEETQAMDHNGVVVLSVG